ncbi:hypothetical protein ACWEN4_24275 [Streptomyces violaceorubidus]
MVRNASWIGDDARTKQFRMRGDTYASKGGSEGKPLQIVDAALTDGVPTDGVPTERANPEAGGENPSPPPAPPGTVTSEFMPVLPVKRAGFAHGVSDQ